MMIADSSQMGIWSGFACSLVAVESSSCCADPTAHWTGKGLGWGWLGCCTLFLPPPSFLCSFMPLPWSYDWLFSLMSATCLDLRLLSAVTVQAVSSAGLCNTVAVTMQAVSSAGLCNTVGVPWLRFPSWSSLKKTALGMCMSSILEICQPGAAAHEARWTACLAGWLSWGLLCLTCSLASWCQGWSALLSTQGHLRMIHQGDWRRYTEEENEEDPQDDMSRRLEGIHRGGKWKRFWSMSEN